MICSCIIYLLLDVLLPNSLRPSLMRTDAKMKDRVWKSEIRVDDIGVTYQIEAMFRSAFNMNWNGEREIRRVQRRLPRQVSTHIWMWDGVLSLNGVSLQMWEEDPIVTSCIRKLDKILHCMNFLNITNKWIKSTKKDRRHNFISILARYSCTIHFLSSSTINSSIRSSWTTSIRDYADRGEVRGWRWWRKPTERPRQD